VAVDPVIQGNVPPGTVQALRAIGAHPFVRSVEATFLPDDGSTSAVIGIDTDLPSRWRARGHSDNGVLSVEPVHFTFGKGFPLLAPAIHLRDDFDRSHPHLQPWGPQLPPEPCLVLGSPSELMRSRGIVGLVEQLFDWLRKAAMLQLIDPKDGWEPTRRDGSQDHASADLDMLRSLPKLDPSAAVFETTFFAFEDGEGQRRFAVQLSNKAAGLSQSQFELKYAAHERPGSYNGNCYAIVAWGGRKSVAGQYNPETVEDIPTLYSKAAEFACADVLGRMLGLVTDRLTSRFRVTAPLLVVLLARRPCNLGGTTSPIEICPYLIELDGPADLSRSGKAVVKLVAMQQTMTMDLLRRASGEPVGGEPRPWTLLGCGSVGSKVAMHMARAGRGPAVVVDKGVMRPHNYARHALTPWAVGDGTDYGAKPDVLAEALCGMRQTPKVGRLDVVARIVADGEGKFLGLREDFAVVNATASASVREALAIPDVASSRPRVVEICLFGAGRMGFMSVEGPGANPTTNDLATEAFRLMAADDDMGDVVFNSEAEILSIGQGCSSITFPMSDARLSALTAPMAGELARLHSAGLPGNGGDILLGIDEEDGLGQSWRRYPQAPWIAVDRKNEMAPRVRLSPRVDAIIIEAVAAKPGKETGGVLVGRFSDVSNTFHVVDVLAAPPDSRFSAAEFVLGTQGLSSQIQGIAARSAGSIYALGTWHNHLVASGPSATDVRTGLHLAETQILPVLMLIQTPGGYRYLTAVVGAEGAGWIDALDDGRAP